MRGVIMETKNGRAVLLTKGGNFVNIKDQGYSVGDKVNIYPNTGRLCAMAASLLIACAGIGSYFMPMGYVSVDINPSLMMTLNIYNRVIDVQSFNDDARVLLNKTNIKGKSAEKSVEMLIKASEEIGYINNDNRDVILEVVPGMIRPDMGRIHHPNIELTNETADRETLRMAQDIGVSMAKVKAIEEYTEKNGGDIRSNAVKFNDKSAKEMRAIMRNDSHLPSNEMREIPPQNPAPKDYKVAPKPQTQIKPPHNTKINIFPVAEPQNEKYMPDNQRPQNNYRSPENAHIQTENNIPKPPPVLNKPPVWNTESVNNPIKTEQNPQGDKILPNKATNEHEQEIQPVHKEQKPQDKTPSQKNDKSEVPSPTETNTTKYDNDRKNQPQMPEKQPDNSANQGSSQQNEPKREETPAQDGKGNTQQNKPPQGEIKGDVQKPNDAQSRNESSSQQKPQKEEAPRQSETKREEAAPRGGQANNNGNSPPNEHREMQ